MKDWIKGWLAEKSTWTGGIALASAFGFADKLTDPQQAAIIALGASLFAMQDRIKK